jgi:CheY-like chemotaxis protein
VLLVDDDPTARDLLTVSLKGAGYRLVHGYQRDLARTIRPDAITLDVVMPATDGSEVLSALKADPDLCDIPVVMVTIVPDRGIGLSLGAVDVLTKPFDRARLRALMHRLLRREGSVLLVEDDADMRDVMRHTITGFASGSLDWTVVAVLADEPPLAPFFGAIRVWVPAGSSASFPATTCMRRWMRRTTAFCLYSAPRQLPVNLRSRGLCRPICLKLDR